MRRRWVYRNGEALEVTYDIYPDAPTGPTVIADLPGYESPITGEWIEGRAARREDLKRHGCRPWEGMDSELAEARKRREYQERETERRLDESAWRAWHEMSPDKRRKLREG